MVSAAVVAFTPLLVEPFPTFMVTAIATFLHHGRTVAPALNLYPTRVDVDVLSHGCRWCEREYRRQQQTVGVFIVTVTSLVFIANTNAQAGIRIRILSDAKWGRTHTSGSQRGT